MVDIICFISFLCHPYSYNLKARHGSDKMLQSPSSHQLPERGGIFFCRNKSRLFMAKTLHWFFGFDCIFCMALGHPPFTVLHARVNKCQRRFIPLCDLTRNGAPYVSIYKRMIYGPWSWIINVQISWCGNSDLLHIQFRTNMVNLVLVVPAVIRLM